jgi:putative transposase
LLRTDTVLLKPTPEQEKKLFRKRQRRFRHATNSLLRDLFERAAKMSIAHLIVGDLSGIRNGNNLGRNTNQKLHNFWSHASILKRIRELGEEFGIQITLVSEAYTSATCCMCGLQHNSRIHRGLHVCSQVHKSINSDVSGAYNIYNVAMNRSLEVETSGSRLMAQPLMLRWEYHQWHQEPPVL